MARQGPQHGFQLPVAFGQFGRIGVIQRHRLLERKEVFLPPVTLQGFGDLLLSGPNAEVLGCSSDTDTLMYRPLWEKHDVFRDLDGTFVGTG